MMSEAIDSYTEYGILKKEFVRTIGYAGRSEISDDLILQLAAFVNRHAKDSMVSYYVRTLLGQFYRKRTRHHSQRLLDVLAAHLDIKTPLLEMIDDLLGEPGAHALLGRYSNSAIWPAIRDLDDGYGRANYMGRYAFLLKGEFAVPAYEAAQAMPEPFRSRALANLYAEADAPIKPMIFSYLCHAFVDRQSEATWGLKRLFPFLDRQSQAAVVALHLDLPAAAEQATAYFVIRNAQYVHADDVAGLLMRIRKFKNDYLRNRCLLKLHAYLGEGELDELFSQFMLQFNVQPPETWLLHNLYQFSAAVPQLDKHRAIALALRKIADFDDTSQRLYDQQKVSSMLFILPHLRAENSGHAFAIAATVRGGYRRTLKARLRRHFSGRLMSCQLRGTPICY